MPLVGLDVVQLQTLESLCKPMPPDNWLVADDPMYRCAWDVDLFCRSPCEYRPLSYSPQHHFCS